MVGVALVLLFDALPAHDRPVPGDEPLIPPLTGLEPLIPGELLRLLAYHLPGHLPIHPLYPVQQPHLHLGVVDLPAGSRLPVAPVPPAADVVHRNAVLFRGVGQARAERLLDDLALLGGGEHTVFAGAGLG